MYRLASTAPHLPAPSKHLTVATRCDHLQVSISLSTPAPHTSETQRHCTRLPQVSPAPMRCLASLTSGNVQLLAARTASRRQAAPAGTPGPRLQPAVLQLRLAGVPWQRQEAGARPARCNAAPQPDSGERAAAAAELVGEDAAVFDPSQQSLRSWGLFAGLLTSVLGLLYVVSATSDKAGWPVLPALQAQVPPPQLPPATVHPTPWPPCFFPSHPPCAAPPRPAGVGCPRDGLGRRFRGGGKLPLLRLVCRHAGNPGGVCPGTQRPRLPAPLRWVVPGRCTVHYAWVPSGWFWWC